MAVLLRFHKPYGVLSQFTDSAGRPTLADYITVADVYPAGRLDRDSEGLLLLTDDGGLQARISQPKHKLEKIYLAQVMGKPRKTTLAKLTSGVDVGPWRSRATHAQIIDPPRLPPREPPPAARHAADSSWLKLAMTTGRNREVRRMLAAVGHPVLRLQRIQVGPWRLGALAPGEWEAERVNLGSAGAVSRPRQRLRSKR
jgi:23S rRNA pseudouridine2457 synthase